MKIASLLFLSLNLHVPCFLGPHDTLPCVLMATGLVYTVTRDGLNHICVTVWATYREGIRYVNRWLSQAYLNKYIYRWSGELLWNLPVLHAVNLMKCNCWFDKGPLGLKLNCNYMSEISKCNTAHPAQTHAYVLIAHSSCRLAIHLRCRQQCKAGRSERTDSIYELFSFCRA